MINKTPFLEQTSVNWHEIIFQDRIAVGDHEIAGVFSLLVHLRQGRPLSSLPSSRVASLLPPYLADVLTSLDLLQALLLVFASSLAIFRSFFDWHAASHVF